jgi:protein-tyrosine phosphatase
MAQIWMSHPERLRNLSEFVATGSAQYLSARRESENTFSILTVCTGNVCRSPAVERLLAQRLGPSVSVSSAGTHALVGHPISDPMARLLRESGVQDETFAARRLTEKLVKDADLILALTRAQRSLVVELSPPAIRRTFTLREFARLLGHVQPSALPDGIAAERLRAALPLTAAERGLQRVSAEEDEVVDPFRLSDEVYAASFAEITTAVNLIVTAAVPGGHDRSRFRRAVN